MKFKSLFKASMTEGMDVFNVKKGGKGIKILLGATIFLPMFGYSNVVLMSLQKFGSDGAVVLSLFVALTSLLTLVEGVYKSSGLLFNCRDDDMLLSMPLSRAQVVALRILKFYVFELIFNSLFLLPAILTYMIHMNPGASFYVVSVIMVFLMPVIPVALSCAIGAIVSSISSRFKRHNVIQTILTLVLTLAIVAVSFTASNSMDNIGAIAGTLNETITKIYYPAKVYTELVGQFDFGKLLIFIAVHALVAIAVVAFIAKIYFRINSRLKTAASPLSKEKVVFVKKVRSPFFALIKKELNRFTSSPVFVANAGIGPLLFLLVVGLICFKFDDFTANINSEEVPLAAETIRAYLPSLTFVLVTFFSFMSFLTASMVSLEGRAFNLLKTLPYASKKIILAKVATALLLIWPPILLGIIVMIFRFQFGIVPSLLIIVGALILPVAVELFGIMVDLKHAKLDAENDTEVVKQSTSVMIATFVGLGGSVVLMIIGASLIIFLGQELGLLAVDIVIFVLLGALYLRFAKTVEKRFKALQI